MWTKLKNWLCRVGWHSMTPDNSLPQINGIRIQCERCGKRAAVYTWI